MNNLTSVASSPKNDLDLRNEVFKRTITLLNTTIIEEKIDGLKGNRCPTKAISNRYKEKTKPAVLTIAQRIRVPENLTAIG